MADFSFPFAEAPAPAPALRVFIDTSVIIAGMVSGRGAAREVLRLGEAGVIRIYPSEQVLTEADRVFSARFPALAADFRKFLRNLEPVLVDDPTRAEVGSVEGWMGAADAPILAAAIMSRADCLVAWDKKPFQSEKVKKLVPLPIFTPAEFLEYFLTAGTGGAG